VLSSVVGYPNVMIRASGCAAGSMSESFSQLTSLLGESGGRSGAVSSDCVSGCGGPFLGSKELGDLQNRSEMKG